MKALLDTGVWVRRYHRLPMRPALRQFLARDITGFHLCPLSVAEITFKWRRSRLPGVPDPARWLPRALENFVIENPSTAAAQQAGQWNWEHGDLVDRVLEAIAKEQDLLLVHTDTILKKFTGFPQKYFPNVAESK